MALLQISDDTSNDFIPISWNETNIISTTTAPQVKAAEVFIENDVTEYLWDIIPPVLLVVGTIGNILSVTVFSRKAFRSTISLYLMVLAISDMFVLYSGLVRQWLVSLINYDIRTYHTATCRILTWLIYSSLDVSAWIIVCVTVERLISVYIPHKVKLFCTKKLSAVVLCVVCLGCCMVNSHFLFFLNLRQLEDGAYSCDSNDTNYYSFLEHIWPWLDLCMYSLGPSFFIIIGNMFLLRKVFRNHLETGCSITDRRQKTIRSNRMSSMTTMLVSISVLFVVCTTPVSIHIILSGHLPEPSPKEISVQRLIWCVENLFMYTGNAINFILYCLSGSRFRKEVFSMFHKLNCFKQRDDSSHNSKSPTGKKLDARSCTSISTLGSSTPVVGLKFYKLPEGIVSK